MDTGRVCVYCASSRRCDPFYLDGARELGGLLARSGRSIVYGGGGTGLMGALADGALAAGGHVTGVIPDFMRRLEWAHDRISRLEVVDDMHARKLRMAERADAFVALPGGCGTLEELLEVITWKRLGLHKKPIVIASWRGFFAPLVAQLEACIEGRFMDPRHGAMWTVVERVADVLPALEGAEPWDEDALELAAP